MSAITQNQPSKQEDQILASIKLVLANAANTTASVREIRDARAKLKEVKP